MAEKTPNPTDAELAILADLWEHGPSTVREVMERLSGQKPAGYTTVLKTMQIMHGKKLLRRDDSSRTHVYRPAQNASRTRGRLVSDLVDRAFEGSTSRLIMQALSSKKATPRELAEIRRLLEEHTNQQNS